jgi:outer membrane protein assembly factor BamB
VRKLSSSLLLSALLTYSAVADSKSWPQWRGPDASGHGYPGTYPTKWSAEENLAWMAKIPGRGHSSAVHENGHIWITTAIETPASEEEKEERLKENEGLSTVTVLSEVSLRAVKLDPKTGGILKNIEVIQKKQPQWVHHLNSYASPSPVIEGNRLYLHFGAYGNACIDAVSGKIIWKNNQKELWVMHENGPGSSPIIWENLMIFHLDGSDKQSIVALFKDTGEIAWQSKRSGELKENPQLRKSYSTPIITNFNGQPILISCSADWVYGYNPRNGEELWKINYGILGFSNVARPIVGHGMFYISTCFMKAEIHAYKYEGLDKPKLAWKMIKGAPKMPSPILVDKQLYVMNDGGILTCVDAISGDVEWRERVGGEFSASPTYANGLLYFSDREGKTTVVKPGSELNIVAENKIDGTAHMASITPYENSFLLRSKKGLYRIGKK